MTATRPLLIACLAACVAGPVRVAAEPPEPSARTAEPGSGMPVQAGSRFSREGYERAPTLPADTPREFRAQSLRSRYELPHDIGLDMHRAIEDAQRRHGGKVLSADRLHSDGRDVYRVKLLTRGGRVRVVQMPETGAADAAGRQQQGEK